MTDVKAIHENFSSGAEVKIGSNRFFGLVFTGVFALVAFVPLIKGHDMRWWALIPAAIFLTAALATPDYLAPFNRIWFRFGRFLHKAVSPLMLGLIFFVIFTPFALFLRLLAKRPLSLGFEPDAATYWIARTPPGPAPESMTHQF